MSQPSLTTQAPHTTLPPARKPGSIIITVVAVIVAFFLLSRLFPHENRYEKLATNITNAIANNDMRPVEKSFNAVRRTQLQDRARVGNLSNMVVPLGKLKRSKENTPSGSPAGYHQFVEQFEKGTLFEKYQLDPDGKVVNFFIGPGATGAKP